jgi:F420-non-reducing hydrogenase iron-sulfur subunit
MMNREAEVSIVAFCCNECSYAAADLAGTSRIQYPPNVRIIRVTCTGKVDLTYILKAFNEGADGVIVAGCLKERCRYIDGNLKAEARVEFLKEIFESIGLGKSRLEMYFMSSAMSDVFVNKVKEFTETIRRLGKVSSS